MYHLNRAGRVLKRCRYTARMATPGHSQGEEHNISEKAETQLKSLLFLQGLSILAVFFRQPLPFSNGHSAAGKGGRNISKSWRRVYHKIPAKVMAIPRLKLWKSNPNTVFWIWFCLIFLFVVFIYSICTLLLAQA